mmetsp:Transcript_15387/g.13124  ORF Transcript_15387/g.13124 Transcript_15387/m.13124 type:complete len:103 (-) Transcript_15387:722-1030(-)
MLFMLATNGVLPYREHEKDMPNSLFTLLQHNPDKFFETHSKTLKKFHQIFTPEFKELFLGMTRADPKDRWTLEKIKKSSWYNKIIYLKSELPKAVRTYTLHY